MSAEKNYYIKSKSSFDAFIGGANSINSLKEATSEAARQIEAGELEVTEDDPVVIFELTNTIRKTKPRPVTSGLVIESNRKLGKRAPKADGDADSVEGAVKPPKTRKGKKNPFETSPETPPVVEAPVV